MKIRVIKDFDTFLKGDILEFVEIAINNYQGGCFSVMRVLDEFGVEKAIVDDKFKNITMIEKRRVSFKDVLEQL